MKNISSQNSLTRTTIIKMGVRIAIIIIAVTLVSYWHVISNLELQIVEQLDKYITERGQRESHLFQLAESNHAIFKKEFLARYEVMGNHDPIERFNSVFEKREDGTVRTLASEFYDMPEIGGTTNKGLTAFIGQNVNITADIRRRIMISYDMVAMYGPPWRYHFPDLYTSLPENVAICYWPEVPWNLNAEADLNIPQEEWFYAADMAHNPNRETVWFGPYFDAPSNTWLISTATPIDDVDGQHILNVSGDFVLNDLVKRAFEEHLEGAYNVIFRKDGHLIFHPEHTIKIQEQGGSFDILQLEEPRLSSLFLMIKNKLSDQRVIDHAQYDEYLAVTKINGPDWYLITVYPKSLMADLALNTASFILFLGLISLLIEITVLFFVLRQQVTQPLQEFIEATQKIAGRNFSVEATQHLPLNRHDEIGELAHSFNGMAGQLKRSFDTLDTKVIERTAQLNDKIEELTKTRQELVQSEKMAALGQLVAGIAHEVNTPLGAIRSSADTLSNNLKHTLHELPKLFKILTPVQQDNFFALLKQSLQGELIFTFREKRAVKKVIAAELEQLGIENRDLIETFLNLNLHKNIQQYLPLLESSHHEWIFDVAYQISTLSISAENITTAVERASKVIFALKTFARYDQSGEKIRFHLPESIETILTLYYNQLKYSIKLIKLYEEVPLISCYPDELNQVWTNIIHNALQAMDYKGTLTIAISQQDTYAVVSITDSGTGMSTEIKEKMFMPFFTTKPAGEGSGLGLDIVKKIIDKHEGKIEVDCEEGKGTTISVFLPI